MTLNDVSDAFQRAVSTLKAFGDALAATVPAAHQSNESTPVMQQQ